MRPKSERCSTSFEADNVHAHDPADRNRSRPNILHGQDEMIDRVNRDYAAAFARPSSVTLTAFSQTTNLGLMSIRTYIPPIASPTISRTIFYPCFLTS